MTRSWQRARVEPDMNWHTPTVSRIQVATDPSCATLGECTAGRCTAKIRSTPVAGFTPVTPGCSRKVNIPLDPVRRTTALRLLSSGTVDGRLRRDRDTLRYKR